MLLSQAIIQADDDPENNDSPLTDIFQKSAVLYSVL